MANEATKEAMRKALESQSKGRLHRPEPFTPVVSKYIDLSDNSTPVPDFTENLPRLVDHNEVVPVGFPADSFMNDPDNSPPELSVEHANKIMDDNKFWFRGGELLKGSDLKPQLPPVPNPSDFTGSSIMDGVVSNLARQLEYQKALTNYYRQLWECECLKHE